MTDKLVIGVTGLQSGTSPSPGIGVARCLRAAYGSDVQLIALGDEFLAAGLYFSDLFDRSFLISPWHQPVCLMRDLDRIRSETGLNFIIPNLDAEQETYATLQLELETRGIHTLLPSQDAINRRAKRSLPSFCEKHGFFTPHTEFIQGPDQVQDTLKQFTPPLFVKGHSFGAYLCNSTQEAKTFVPQLAHMWGWPVLVQAFVRGEEYSVAALGTTSGEPLSAVCMRKLALTEQGKAWCGITVGDSELLAIARQLVSHLAWTGPIEVDLIKEPGMGNTHVIDINPRFPAWIYLAAVAGQNLPAMTIRMGFGDMMNNQNSSYRTGVIFARYPYDLVFTVGKMAAFATGLLDVRSCR